MDTDYYMMWLSRLSSISPRRAENLLSFFASPKKIWEADKYCLTKVNGITESTAEKICAEKDEEILSEWINELEEKGIEYISRLNPKFPELLKNIDYPPLGIYVRGKLPDDSVKKFSIVGSRVCSEYGAWAAYKFAKDLAEKNFVIVSGMAKGIDSYAHKGAIAAGGTTIAVLGTGVDVCYPAENNKLMENILKNGCIISEYPPKTKAMPQNFPKRNRIIAGLSMGLLVAEAGKHSGSLITVDAALDNGRTVFTLPANITSSLSCGGNALIKEGCPIATSVEDILIELGIKEEKEKKVSEEKMELPLKEEEKEVYDIINEEPLSLEEISLKLKKPVKDIQYILTFLELYGYITALAGQRYIKSF